MTLKNDNPGTITVAGAEYIASANQYVVYRGVDTTLTVTATNITGLDKVLSYWSWYVKFASGSSLTYTKLYPRVHVSMLRFRITEYFLTLTNSLQSYRFQVDGTVHQLPTVIMTVGGLLRHHMILERLTLNV